MAQDNVEIVRRSFALLSWREAVDAVGLSA